MTQLDYGPVNITQGNSAKFVAEFYDVNGNLTSPSSAVLSITYINTSNVSATDTVSLVFTQGVYVGVWSSISASYGLASWSITTNVSSAISQIGQIRVIDP